jgi:hypothetical protein
MGGGLKQLFTIKCNIFSMGDGSWKKLSSNHPSPLQFFIDGSGLFEEYLEMGRIKKKLSIHKESCFIDLIHTNTK